MTQLSAWAWADRAPGPAKPLFEDPNQADLCLPSPLVCTRAKPLMERLLGRCRLEAGLPRSGAGCREPVPFSVTINVPVAKPHIPCNPSGKTRAGAPRKRPRGSLLPLEEPQAQGRPLGVRCCQPVATRSLELVSAAPAGEQPSAPSLTRGAESGTTMLRWVTSLPHAVLSGAEDAHGVTSLTLTPLYQATANPAVQT